MNLDLQSNLAAFNSALSRYITAHQGRKAVDDILEAKGRDLGIRLYQGFRERKWGGAGKKSKGLARRELDARVAQGRGITVRRSIMEDYLSSRSALREKQRGKEPTNSRIEARTRLWRSFVGRELAARQRGIGVLAASFLWYRSRSSQARGTYVVRNRTKRVLGGVEKGEGFLRIFGETEGLSDVDARYGVVAEAITGATADIEQYFRERPEYWQFWNTFNSLGGSAA